MDGAHVQRRNPVSYTINHACWSVVLIQAMLWLPSSTDLYFWSANDSSWSDLFCETTQHLLAPLWQFLNRQFQRYCLLIHCADCVHCEAVVNSYFIVTSLDRVCANDCSVLTLKLCSIIKIVCLSLSGETIHSSLNPKLANGDCWYVLWNEVGVFFTLLFEFQLQVINF